MQTDNALKYLFAVALTVAGLHLWGMASPDSLNWGYHFLGFLPLPYTICFVALFAIISFTITKTDVTKGVQNLARYAEHNPLRFLVITIIAFICAAFLFRVKASLLGDSFTIIKNYTDYEQGLSPLAPWHEPFAMFFFYYALSAFSGFVYPDLFWSFLSVEIFLGIAFIAIMYFTVRFLIEDPVWRVLTFLLVLVMPYMEFFFGYIEIYAFSIVVLAGFIFLAVMVLREKLPVYLLIWCYVILTFSHYINALAGVSVLYIAYLEYKKKKITELTAGFGGALLLILLIFTLVQFDITRLINISPVSHQLSFTEDISLVNQYSQAYTFFSIYHFTDIANYIVLMSPLALWVTIYAFRKTKLRFAEQSPFTLWLLCAIIPAGIYLFFAKLEQGFADDWDVFASFFVFIALLASYLLYQLKSKASILLMTALVLFSALFSLPMFTLNALTEPSIQRFQTLWDKRNVSHLGQYTMALRLTRYYDAVQDSVNPPEVWKYYRSLFPNDPRGFNNEIEKLHELSEDSSGRILQIYGELLALEPTNKSVRKNLAEEYLKTGTELYTHQQFDSAALFFANAIKFDSTLPQAYNNLGTIYAMKGDLDKAIPQFTKAIALDSTYSDAYYNLGLALTDEGHTEEGNTYIRKAASMGNQAAKEGL